MIKKDLIVSPHVINAPVAYNLNQGEKPFATGIKKIIAIDNIDKNRFLDVNNFFIDNREDCYQSHSEIVQIDYIYSCRRELEHCPLSSLTYKGQREIPITLSCWRQPRLLTFTKIQLPSKNEIYMTEYQSKTLLSDGDIYHISDLVHPPATSWLSLLVNLISHLAQTVNLHSPLYRQSRAQPAPRSFFSQFLTLPGAEASTYANLDPIVPENKPGCRIEIQLPDAKAMELHQELVGEYAQTSRYTEQSLKWLDGYDRFLAIKVKNVFELALHLKNKRAAVDTLLIKKYSEKILEECSALASSLTSQDENAFDSLRERELVSDFLINQKNDMNLAFKNINFKILREAVVIKNGMSFDDAKRYIKDKYNGKTHSGIREHYKWYYRYIALMEKAHADYIEHLGYAENYSVLNRVLFKNDREIYGLLIDEDIADLENELIKRMFYYIFEYNRNKGNSINSLTVMIPGEFTEYWQLFKHEYENINVEQLTSTFVKQIMLFNEKNEVENFHLNRILKLIAFNRMRSQLDMSSDWGIDDDPIEESIKFLENNIKNLLTPPIDAIETGYSQWYMDTSQQIKFDKECIILLEYFSTLHKKFNAVLRLNKQHPEYSVSLTQEQSLAMAKIAAMRYLKPAGVALDDDQQLLVRYYLSIQDLQFEPLIVAAAFWYIDVYSSEYRKYLRNLDVLSIIQKFQQQDLINTENIKLRDVEIYTSVFSLLKYDRFAFPEVYFNQFIEYKLHDVYHESRDISLNIIKYSNVDYLDIIFPPKEIYTFKIYSRRYIQNTLASQVWVSTPANNIGYIVILRLHSNKLALLSTLMSAPFIRILDESVNRAFMYKMINDWKKTIFHLNIRNREHYNATMEEMDSLLFSFANQDIDMQDGWNSILVQPEKNRLTHPAAEFSLVADKKNGGYDSLLAALDYWNEQTLLEVAEVMKDELKDDTWIDYLTRQVPFYEVLWHHWYDAEHEFEFKDLLFDVFDLVTILIPSGLSVKRVGKSTLTAILAKAKASNIPANGLRHFIVSHLVKKSPQIIYRGSINFAQQMISFFNPLPFGGLIGNSLKNFLAKNMQQKMGWINEYVADILKIKKVTLKSWASEIDRDLLTIEDDGLFSSFINNESLQRYIEIDHAFFPTLWDDTMKIWRVTHSENRDNYNHAVPMNKNNNGQWTAAFFNDTDPISPLNSILKSHSNFDSHFGEIKFEPFYKVDGKSHKIDKKSIPIKKYLQTFVDFFGSTFRNKFHHIKNKVNIINLFISCLMNKEKFAEFARGQGNGVRTADIEEHLSKIRNYHKLKVKFRVVYIWLSELDHAPASNLILNVNMHNAVYIIDLAWLRSLDNDNDTPIEVFYEREWSIFYSHIGKYKNALIKFKDFSHLEDAMRFSQRSTLAPGLYVKGVFVLKEPIWYKVALIKTRYEQYRKSLLDDVLHNNDILSAARVTIADALLYESADWPRPKLVGFPLSVLKISMPLSQADYTRLTGLVSIAATYKMPIDAYFTSHRELDNFDDVLRIQKGCLLAVLSPDGILCHLSVCVGSGRFAGAGNHLFNHDFQHRPEIIVAEEMGVFITGKFHSRANGGPYQLVAGTVADLADQKNILTNAPAANAASNADTSIGARERALLGGQWSIVRENATSSSLHIKTNMPNFKNNHMSASELTHIIRGLTFVNDDLPGFNELESVKLVSCFERYDEGAFFGQILANELNLMVESYPYYITDKVQLRHPHWFTIYLPHAKNDTLMATPFDEFSVLRRKQRLALKKRRLNDLVGMVLYIKKTFHHGVAKRSNTHLPSVYINIARFILNDIPFMGFVRYHGLTQTSSDLLRKIMDEYQHVMLNSEDIFIQYYFDILHSIREFNHLIRWLKPALP